MKGKFKLLVKSLKLVWQSAPGWAAFNTFLSVLRSIFPLLLILLLKNVIDVINAAAAEGGTAAFSTVLWPVIILIIAWFFDEALSDISNYVRKKQAMVFEMHMYDLLHSKACRLDLIHFENPQYFDCLTRAVRDAPWRPNNVLNNIVSASRSFFSLLLMGGLILTFNWTLAILLLVANIPGVLLRLHYADVLYRFQREQTTESRRSSYLNWLLTGDRPSREIRLFGLGKYFRDLFKVSFLKQKEEELDIIRKRTMVELVSDLFKASALLISVLVIARNTVEGRISLGQMAMFLVAFRQGLFYIKDLFGSLAGLYEDTLFIGDTFEFLNLKETISAKEPVEVLSPLQRGIKIENVSFTYPGNKSKTLNDLSFDITHGETIAIVGNNGAGKSTLARLLCRLYDPDSGVIRYDGTDIKNFDPGKFRKQFSVVFQDFMLYNLSAGENIRLGNIDDKNPAERIKSSASAIGVHALIKDLPEGYNTLIGNLFDNSRELSWGEWQKIALSRALFRDAPVLILDEPSSSLDTDTEYEIFSRFKEIVKGRTSVLISHRFNNVSLADRIIVLDNGRIIENGSHHELIAIKGAYYSMYMKQTSRFENPAL